MDLGLSLSEVHTQFSWFVVVSNGVAGLWALGAHSQPALRHRALWLFTLVAELTVFAQAIIGVVMVSAQDLVAPEFHMFYGFLGIIAVAIIYSYRHQLEAHRYLLYGGGGLFLMGLGLRAIYLG